MSEFQHRVAGGATEEAAKNLEDIRAQLETEPLRFEGEVRALQLAQKRLGEFKKRALLENKAGKLPDEAWLHVDQYMKACLSTLAVLANDAQVARYRMEGQLQGLKNAKAVIDKHTESHRQQEVLASEGEDVLSSVVAEDGASVVAEDDNVTHLPAPSDDEVVAFAKDHKLKELRDKADRAGVEITGTKTQLARRLLLHELRAEHGLHTG